VVKTISKIFLSVLIATAGIETAYAIGGDPKTGKTKAQACAVCHGPMGMAINPGAPHLAGQPAIYLVEQLHDFKSGKRQNPVMSVIAKPLTEADILDLAAWYSTIEIELKTK